MPPRTTGAIRGRATERRDAKTFALPFADLAEVVRKRIDLRLNAYLDAELRSAAKLGSEVSEMVTALSDLCRRGGKRLRPTLLVAGALAASDRVELDVLLKAGVALELLQSYFLIHDDWMDRDAMRRGGPSVHALLARRFKDTHKGEASAILAGDYCLALATSVLAGLPVTVEGQRPLFESFARMQRSAVLGQQIDIIARSEDVERAYALKTGSYTVQGPLELGAILAGGSPATLRGLVRFSAPLGIAFQLRDDLLGAFGTPDQTGKPFGADIRAGKRTVLLLKTLAVARGSEQRLLRRVVGNRTAGDAEVRRVLSVFERTGARAEVEDRIKRLAGSALRRLGSGMTPRGRFLLGGAVQALTERGG